VNLSVNKGCFCEKDFKGILGETPRLRTAVKIMVPGNGKVQLEIHRRTKNGISECPYFKGKSHCLLAVWTHNNYSSNFGYIGQLWKYLQVNKSNLKKCLILGDFNSNVFWDKSHRWWNHSDVVKELKEVGIESLYHNYWNEEQGKETRPTLFISPLVVGKI